MRRFPDRLTLTRKVLVLYTRATYHLDKPNFPEQAELSTLDHHSLGKVALFALLLGSSVSNL